MEHVNYKEDKIKLCVDCFLCKTKNKKVYCKLGFWEEVDDGKSILHTPFDFDCTEWDG